MEVRVAEKKAEVRVVWMRVGLVEDGERGRRFVDVMVVWRMVDTSASGETLEMESGLLPWVKVRSLFIDTRARFRRSPGLPTLMEP